MNALEFELLKARRAGVFRWGAVVVAVGVPALSTAFYWARRWPHRWRSCQAGAQRQRASRSRPPMVQLQIGDDRSRGDAGRPPIPGWALLTVNSPYRGGVSIRCPTRLHTARSALTTGQPNTSAVPAGGWWTVGTRTLRISWPGAALGGLVATTVFILLR